MHRGHIYSVHIMTNLLDTVLYTGVTGHLAERVQQHKEKQVSGFTARYNLNKLVYHEETSDIGAAISREKQIKGWTRVKKNKLIESVNPEWKDLSFEL
ncbi:MAG: GIY-YIG nuclease family protein [Candidatus Uhrbacteria bacterium]|nr:GIY-YIG nuclease family protein [Candidatus Uhrbacteria bacterium]